MGRGGKYWSSSLHTAGTSEAGRAELLALKGLRAASSSELLHSRHNAVLCWLFRPAYFVACLPSACRAPPARAPPRDTSQNGYLVVGAGFRRQQAPFLFPWAGGKHELAADPPRTPSNDQRAPQPSTSADGR